MLFSSIISVQVIDIFLSLLQLNIQHSGIQ